MQQELAPVVQAPRGREAEPIDRRRQSAGEAEPLQSQQEAGSHDRRVVGSMTRTAARALALSQSGEDCFDALEPEAQEALRENVRAVLRTLREPSEAMIEAAAETPGMKAASNAMAMHQARGYGFDKGSFVDGSPLQQAWHAMVDAALAE